MIISYEEFIAKLNVKIKSDDDFNYKLLATVIENPNRYTGIFRLSNAKTKLVQNVTQSREIKFGDFMEDIVTDYISKMGYGNLNKSIGNDKEGTALSADQFFETESTAYLIEQKIRDDHDSTKKRGQYQNFRAKYMLLKRQFPRKTVEASMWFIDERFVKNKDYYMKEAKAETEVGINIHIFYGGTLFSQLFGRNDVWEEITSYLKKNKRERSEEILTIPDFDTSDEMLRALKKLRSEKDALYRKLISNAPAYEQLRAELFPTGLNLSRVQGWTLPQ